MQIKTILIFHVTPVRGYAVSKTPSITNIAKDVGKRNLHTLMVGM
jgi:hypothetical protein